MTTETYADLDELTPEIAAGLPEGRVLDSIVARLMGRRVSMQYDFDLGLCPVLVGKGKRPEPVPYYSTDIVSAIKLAETFRFRMEPVGNRWKVEGKEVEAVAFSLAHAIAKCYVLYKIKRAE